MEDYGNVCAYCVDVDVFVSFVVTDDCVADVCGVDDASVCTLQTFHTFIHVCPHILIVLCVIGLSIYSPNYTRC